MLKHKTGSTRKAPLVPFATIVSVAIAASTIMFLSPAYATDDGLVIRAGTCSANAFKNGSGVTVSDDYVSNLSVNCTTDTNNKANYQNYLQGIAGYGQYCVATMKSIGIVGGKIKKDPVDGNPNHCLLAGKATELAKKLTKYQ